MSFLKSMFPFISAAASLGGPLGTMAANAVGKALGVDKVDASPNGIESAITKAGAAPEQIAAMQKAEQDFAIEMRKLGFEEAAAILKMGYDDTANARSREIAVRDNTPKYLAYGVCSLVIVAEGFILLHGAPQTVDPVIVGRILGTLDSALILVLGYYFGSSHSSDQKNEIISNLSK